MIRKLNPKVCFFWQVLLSHTLPETCNLSLFVPEVQLGVLVILSSDINLVRADIIFALVTAISSKRYNLENGVKISESEDWVLFLHFYILNSDVLQFHGLTRAAYVNMMAVNASEH